MKVLFSIIPGHGHFFPYLPLARALVADGHEVVFATSDMYGETIREYGFDAIGVGIDYTQGSVEFEDGNAEPVEKIMFVDNPPRVLADLLDYLPDSGVDVLLSDPTENGGMVAAEASGISWGGVVPGRRGGFYPGFVPFEDSDRPDSDYFGAYQTMRSLRSAAGLEPREYLFGEFPYDRTFSLCMAPESFNGWPLPAQHHTSHPLRPEVHRSDSDDQWLEGLPDDLPVVSISFGTLFGSPELYSDAAQAALETGARVVVSSSYEIDVEDDRLTKVKWVSMDRLLERSDVFVHHAGWGSTVAALATGTPSIVVPIGADQFANAQGFKNTGAGARVARDQVGSDLADALASVLKDDVYRLNAERVQAEIEAMPSARDVIPLIERLATDGVVLNKPQT
ncbi:MAG: glycosyltransferase [Actinobacteria bacterium]|nr:MAG: glycosyltransferase [Actinomycetota bacterium]